MANKNSRIAFQVRIDEDTHKKLKYISDKELRNLNSQLEYFLVKGIEQFEKENGTIPLSEE